MNGLYNKKRPRYLPRWDVARWIYDAPRRTGVTGMVSIAALLLIAAGMVVLDTQAENRQEAALAAYVASSGSEPVAFLSRAARAHRLFFLSDIEDAAEPKRLAARIITSVATNPGLDAVVLEVPVSEQPFIDRYLNTRPEDASILYGRPRAVHQHDAASREYLEIYRTIYRLNEQLGPGRSIRVIAADAPTWPPERALAPRQAARVYATRDQFMAEYVQENVLGPYPRSRTLLFVGGYHALRGGTGAFHVGGSEPIRVTWLAARLAQDHPTEVFTALLEGSARGSEPGAVSGYTSTRAFDVIRKSKRGVRAPVAVRIDEHFDFLRLPVTANSGPGLELDLLPRDYRLRDVADAYVYLGSR